MRSIPSDLPYVKCTKCKQPYPLTNEFFAHDKRKKNGFSSQCKTCVNVYSRQYREANKEEIKKKEKKRNILRREEYREYRKRESYKVGRKQYRSAHREETVEYQRQYRLVNKNKLNADKKEYRKTEKGYAVKKASNHKRRIQKKEIGGTLTSQQIQTKLKAQKHKCYYCQKKLEKVEGKYVYHLEHTVPLGRPEYNPQHDASYVVLACPKCNLKKNNKLPHEWPEGGRLL